MQSFQSSYRTTPMLPQFQLSRSQVELGKVHRLRQHLRRPLVQSLGPSRISMQTVWEYNIWPVLTRDAIGGQARDESAESSGEK